jgi:hypothetical protein
LRSPTSLHEPKRQGRDRVALFDENMAATRGDALSAKLRALPGSAKARALC